MMRFSISTLLFATLCLSGEKAFAQLPPQTSPVTLKSQGREIKGYRKGELEYFSKIPFAEPPVGNLRWKPPVTISIPAKLDASGAPHVCLQWSPEKKETIGSEDCLYLKVVRPANANEKSKLPVVVWIHGGAFVAGSALGDAFSLDNAIVVSIQYRLGVLGFFAHPSIASETANFGLLDMVAALSWIKTNIHLFGGNADDVTVMGFSAGGQAVNALSVMKEARGLFGKAIAISGYASTKLPSLELMHTQTELFLDTKFRFSGPKDYTRLKSISGELLVSLWNEMYGISTLINDGKVITAPALVGMAKHAPKELIFVTGAESYDGSVGELLSPHTEAVHELMPNDVKTYYKDAPKFKAFGDFRYYAGAFHMANALNQFGNQVWLYFDDYPGDDRPNGAHHGDLVRRVFQNPTLKNAFFEMIFELGTPKQSKAWRRYNQNSNCWLVIKSTFDFVCQEKSALFKLFEKYP